MLGQAEIPWRSAPVISLCDSLTRALSVSYVQKIKAKNKNVSHWLICYKLWKKTNQSMESLFIIYKLEL